MNISVTVSVCLVGRAPDFFSSVFFLCVIVRCCCAQTTNDINCEWVFLCFIRLHKTTVRRRKKNILHTDDILIVSYILCKTIHFCVCVWCAYDHTNETDLRSLDSVGLFSRFMVFLSCFASFQLHDYGLEKNNFG